MDNRNHNRRRTLKKGLLIVSSSGFVTECLVRNMSAGGAGIWLQSSTTLPKQFDLMIPVDNLRIGVRLAWQCGQEVGVEFVGAARAAAERRRAGRSCAVA